MEQETTVSPVAETQNPAPESAVTPEVAAPETEQQTPEETPKEDEAQKAIRRMQRRIDSKHAQAAAAEERARLVEQRAAELQQKLAQYEQPAEQPQQQVDPVQLAELIANKRLIDSKSNKVAEEGKKRFPDFPEALKEVAQEAGPLFDAQRYGLPTPLGEAILESDDPAAVLHYLGTNPDVAAELRGLTPIQVARKVARIEAQMQAPKEPKQSAAPKALQPVKASSRDDGGLSDNLPVEEWARRFQKLRRGQ